VSAESNGGTREIRVPAAEVEIRDEIVRVTWWPSSKRTVKAVFSGVTDDNLVVLDYLLEIITQQRGESFTKREEEPSLDDVPDELLAIVEAEGYRPAEEVGR
jgi:hypothetical protein